jgi:hypothetical protein
MGRGLQSKAGRYGAKGMTAKALLKPVACGYGKKRG